MRRMTDGLATFLAEHGTAASAGFLLGVIAAIVAVCLVARCG